MTLTYHQAIFDLVTQSPRIAENHTEHLTALEAYYGITLAAAVREFFMLENYADLIRGNDDHIIPIDIFGWKTHSLLNHDTRWKTPFINPDKRLSVSWERRDEEALYLRIIIENQGVYTWAIALNTGDNPPVLVRENGRNKPWIPSAFTFSEFVYSRVADWWCDKSTFRLQTATTMSQEERDKVLKHLYRHYDARPVTEDIPGYRVYRFYRPGIRVGLSTIRTENTAWWMLFAESEAALRKLFHSLWQYSDFTSRVVQFWTHEERGMEVLEELRHEMPRGLNE